MTAVLGSRHASCTSSAASTPAVSREIAASSAPRWFRSVGLTRVALFVLGSANSYYVIAKGEKVG